MTYRIFLSHNHADKPVVEPVAIRLRDIFGQDQVFYDAWSIKPGDGIISKMNEGLEAPEFVFFFVSASSLKSDMVRLEWQNALYSASKGKSRIIPIRVDGTQMPPILMQTLYIDMYTNGLEAAIVQIVNVAQGNASFTPQHQGFSNLTFGAELQDNGAIDIIIRASHFMEPKVSFMLLIGNTQDEVHGSVPGAPGFHSDFITGVNFGSGRTHNAICLSPMNAALTPAFPVRMNLARRGTAPIDFRGVLHQVGEDEWRAIPRAS